MVGSQLTQDPGDVPPMEQILQMFEELKSRLEATATATQQNVVDLTEQQSASFFGSKNSLEKLDKFKEKQDQLSLRVLAVKDWMRSQAPENFVLDPPGASLNEETSKYIPPNERARANPKFGAQKTLQFTSGVRTFKNLPSHGSVCQDPPRISPRNPR
ncbi:hypothetical protein ACLB2K_029277 [Fragaria x ananassa]